MQIGMTTTHNSKELPMFQHHIKSLAYKAVLARRAEGVDVFSTWFLTCEQYPQLSGRVVKALISRADAQLGISKF